MGKLGTKVKIAIFAGIFVFSLGGAAMAQHGHGPGGGSSGSSAQKGRPVQSVTVNGFKITLDIMDMSMHSSMQKAKGNPAMGEMDHAKGHAIMVTVQDTASKEIITDAKVSYTLIAPSGAKETGNLDWSGDHYGRGFNAQEKGSYQLQVKIETGGMERQAKFTHKI